jgi:hypothetical protein
MTLTAEPFYRSSNGDAWSLVGKPDGSVVVRHEANAASGGTVTETGLAAFLQHGGGSPEQQVLHALVASMPDFQFLAERGEGAPVAMEHVSAAQFRAARALLGWDMGRVAKDCDLDPAEVDALERGHGGTSAGASLRLKAGFEMAGIAFVSEGAVSFGGAGVRLVGGGTSQTKPGEAQAAESNDNDEDASGEQEARL